MGIPISEIDAMRVEAALYLPDTCNIWTLTNSRDSIGGMSAASTAIRTAVPCRYMGGPEGWEALVGMKPQVGGVGVFSMNGTVSINLTDIIVYNSTKYYIRGTNEVNSERMLTRVAVEMANG